MLCYGELYHRNYNIAEHLRVMVQEHCHYFFVSSIMKVDIDDGTE